MRPMLAAALALFAFVSAAEAPQEHYYHCRLERPAAGGRLKAEARLREDGSVEWRSLDWSSAADLRPLVIGATWWPRPMGGMWPSPPLASMSYFYGRPGQRILFELRDESGEILYASRRVRRRDGFFHHPLALDRLRAAADRAGVLHAVAIDGDGRIVARDRIEARALAEVERQATVLLEDLAPMIANYRAACDSSRDAILIIG